VPVPGIELELLHVRRRLLPPRVEKLLRVVLPRFLDVLLAGRDVMHQIQSQAVRLLVVAAGGDFPDGALHDHASVEVGEPA